MSERNTRQKYIVLKVLKDNRNHPTIAEIFELAQKIDPTIGQATVYRNVKKLVDDKKIYQIKTKSGIDRYDYYKNHIHFECLKCGKLIDIMDDNLLQDLTLNFHHCSKSIENYNLMLEGYCENCK